MSLRKFKINVNGKSYEVEVEEMLDGSAPINRNVQTADLVQPQSNSPVQPQAVQTKTSAVPATATSVKAPMPGTIMSVNVNQGDTINEGEVICILEAMKMENEIMAPKSGKVVALNITKGASVNSDDILAAIE